MSRIVFVLQGGKPTPAFQVEENTFVLPSGKRKKSLQVLAPSSLKGKYEPATFKTALKEAERKVEKLAEEVDDELLWETITSPASLEEIAEVYYGEKVGDERLVALFLKLSSSPLFKRKGELFVPRDRQEVEELRKAEEAKERRKEKVNRFLEAIKTGEKNEETEELFSLLRNYVINQGEIPEKNLVQEIMEGLGLRGISGLISFLAKMGRWSDDEEPLIEKLNLNKPFKADIITASKKLPISDQGREEEPAEALAIDEATTVEVDDAISLRREGQDYILGVHVCDLEAFIPRESDLDREAMKRAQTVYLPEKRYFMLPQELITELYTLSPDRPSRALSLYLRLGPELEIKNWWFTRTFVRIRRMSYEEADNLLEKEFPVLYEFFQRRLQARKERGALIVNLPELEIKIEGEKVELERKDLNTPAHQAIQEAMVLYNEKAAELLVKKGVAAVFRTQPFEPGEVPEIDPEDPLYFLKIIPFLKASQLTTHPQPNLSLGVNFYTQASSPLRRYGDLVMQRQMAYALGLSPQSYSTEELMAIFEYLEERTKQIKELVRSRRTYWILKYLQQREGKHIIGYYSRYMSGRHFAFFPDLLMEFPVNLPWQRPQRPGREFVFRISKVELRKRKLILNLV